MSDTPETAQQRWLGGLVTTTHSRLGKTTGHSLSLFFGTIAMSLSSTNDEQRHADTLSVRVYRIEVSMGLAFWPRLSK